MLRVEGLTGRPSGPTLTFDVPDGRCIGLLGRDEPVLRSVAELISGLRAPSHGHVFIDGLDTVRDASRTHALVTCTISRAAHRLTSVIEHVSAVAGGRGRLRTSVTDGIARLGLDAKMRLSSPAARSAASLVAALVPDASVIVLHDPFKDLDDDTRAKAIAWIRALGESRAAIVVTGTEERDVRAVSHTVIDLEAGR